MYAEKERSLFRITGDAGYGNAKETDEYQYV